MPPRVASFFPTGTEWAYALGLDDRLVAVTSACSVPERARREKPVVVRSALDGADLPPDAVDRFVRDLLADGGILHRLDEDALRAARPDVLLAQALCDVCSASHAQVEEATAVLGYRPALVDLSPARLDEALEGARLVAAAMGAPARGAELLASLRVRLDAVRRAVAGRPRPRLVLLEWSDPPMRCGHWLPDVVEAAGGAEVLGDPGGRSVHVSWDDVARARPDVLVVAPCGFGLERAAEEARAVAKRFPMTRVVAMDADRHLARSGPSLATSVEVLAHVLHPEAWPRDADPEAWREVQRAS